MENELRCAECDKIIDGNYFEILDNHFIISEYTNVGADENLTKFCSKQCILDRFSVEEKNINDIE